MINVRHKVSDSKRKLDYADSIFLKKSWLMWLSIDKELIILSIANVMNSTFPISKSPTQSQNDWNAVKIILRTKENKNAKGKQAYLSNNSK